jgi:hypothetical protein
MIGRNEFEDVKSFWGEMLQSNKVVDLEEEATILLKEWVTLTHKAEIELSLFKLVQITGAYAETLP